MSDDARPPADDNPADDAPKKDRLSKFLDERAKQDAEAARWAELEQRGDPLPSQDQPEPTRPHTVASPSGAPKPAENQDTPPKREVPTDPVDAAPRPAKLQDQPQRLPFPHPTDKPKPAQAPHPLDSTPPGPPEIPTVDNEPPMPDPFAEEAGHATPPPRRPDVLPHHRYEDPPEKIKEVRLGPDGMPLPGVPQTDLDATVVSRSAYQQETPPPPPTKVHDQRRPQQKDLPTESMQGRDVGRGRAQISEPLPPPRPASRPAPPPPQPVQPQRGRAGGQDVTKDRPKKRKKRRRRIRLSFGQIIGLLFVLGIMGVVFGAGGAAIYYSQVTAPAFRDITEISDLQGRAFQFQTTRIYDSQDNLLYEINDPNGGRRNYVTLDEISPYVIHATIATEERGYFLNPGFSIYGIVRAVVQNYREGEVVSGASTITQQLTRALLLPEEERYEQSYSRKIKEIFLAAELTRRFTKEEILELYLNQIYYGNLAYGIEAASETYFDKSASELNLAEASFIAGLGQSPAFWDPVTNLEGAIIRHSQVLGLMVEANCIDTGTSPLELPCVTGDQLLSPEVQGQITEVAIRNYTAPRIAAEYPHWVVYIQQQLEADPVIGPSIYTGGYDVYTTIDPRLQDIAEAQVENTIAGLADRNVTNASVIAVDIDTGAILAMVGSADFNNEAISGQVNVALTPQQPGSSIKPFTYLAAFRKGWTPATVIWDVPIEYAIPGFGVYAPVNYDGNYRGPVTVRYSIANSLNIPAVTTLDFVSVPALLQVLNDVGVDSLGDPSNPNNYGLALTLGSGEVYLLDWTNAYATIANGGTRRPLYGIQRIERDGEILEGYPYEVPPGEQVIDPGNAYLLQDIMSDKEARIPSFGQNSPLSPPYPAGAKTGTTNDFLDNWTMGYTTEIAVGVWVGNSDNSPMLNVTGVTGAGPIWRGVMDGAALLSEYAPQEFPRPEGINEFEVCADDGAIPSEYCRENSEVVTEVFYGNPPGPDQSIYTQVKVDTFTGLIANEFCDTYTREVPFIDLPNHSQLIDIRDFIEGWLLNTGSGQAWMSERGIPSNFIGQDAPNQACGPDTPQPTIIITSPEEGSTQPNLVTITGTADVPNFDFYRVEFGVSHDPQAWGEAQGNTSVAVQDGVLAQVDLEPYGDGPMSIRLIVFDTNGNSAEYVVRFMLEIPTPTPTPTPTETPTPTPTSTVFAPSVIETATPTPDN